MNALSTRLAGLATDSGGDADRRPPLVLLHGLTFDRTMWRPTLDALHTYDPGRRYVALDLPGHGESTELPHYELEAVANAINRAVREAGLESPIVVGHSMSAVVATVYATLHPICGVINVDQSLQTAPFCQMLKSLADKIRGPGFPAVWAMLARSFHTELLPESAQHLVRSTCRPRQDVVVGYWQEALDLPISELTAITEIGLASIRAAGLPYLVVAGDELEAEYRKWLQKMLPQVGVVVWPRSSHFPHLAHPHRFAKLLASTAQWSRGTHQPAVTTGAKST